MEKFFEYLLSKSNNLKINKNKNVKIQRDLFYIFPQILIFLYGIPVENKYKILTVKTRKTKKTKILKKAR